MERWSVLGKLFVWFETLNDQKGVGPFITLSSLVAAVVAITLATYHFEADVLTKQITENHAEYEYRLSEIQSKLEQRIPPKVRSPLPIFPKNDQTLVREPEGETTIQLEWADRDKEHHHKYVVQVVCIAEIPPGNSSRKSSENSEPEGYTNPRCGPDKLDADTPNGTTFHWTQSGVDTVKVPIEGTGTYAWRVARGEIADKGDTTIFEEWSPYFIFTMFQSYWQRVYTMNEVLIGIVEGSALQKEGKGLTKKEKGLVDLIQDEQFNKKLPRYRSYATYEALIAAVARGEVDYAIGQITRAKYREEYGVFFTRGYNDALPIFLSKQSMARPPLDGDTIGVVAGSISERALGHLAKSKQFRVKSRLTLDALKDDLQSGRVHFIFTERLGLASSQAAAEQNLSVLGFRYAGTLYSELQGFYDHKLGYTAMHAIATANQSLCKNLDWLIADDSMRHADKNFDIHSADSVVQQILVIYQEEGATLFNRSLYSRLVDKFFRAAEPSCTQP